MQTFIESLGANAILFGVYLGYQVINRCLHSKCRYNKNSGLDFDLGPTGEEASPAAEMGRIAELLKSRSLHHAQQS